MNMIVGIDPGYSGAIAFYDPSGIDIHDMPVAPNPKGKTELDMHSLARVLIPRTAGRSIAVVEKVNAMPGQGVSSTFRFGEGFGAIQMALIGHGYELHFVTPASWKKHFGLSRDKGVSRGLASRRFPDSSKLFSRVKDDGRAEAALIALYGAEKLYPTLFPSFAP